MSGHACESCAVAAELERMGVDVASFDRVVALAGNPNTGKSTLFNALTGLRQHTGNWPGKTVTRAEGGFEFNRIRYKLVDLPGTYSLLSTSADEEVARDFLLFGRPDVTIVVTDATALERNLNLALQVLEITNRVVVAVNLMDEAQRKGLEVDLRTLARDLGVPVVGLVARTGEGIQALLAQVEAVGSGAAIGMRPAATSDGAGRAATLAGGFGEAPDDRVIEARYEEASRIAGRAVAGADRRPDLDQRLDRIVTSPVFGLPIMALILAAIFWITVAGANVPSALLADGLFWVEAQGVAAFEGLGMPWWVTGFVWNGVFRGLAWVVSVMLPPMAIFFPLFTILEDFGYLPRVAFNLDFLFRRAGAHGKQALSMAMGFGCNAAGIIATRVIESPRERLIAILTNNFVPCNGRYPTLIMLATIFVGASMSPLLASLAAAAAVVGVVIIGIITTLIVSWALSRTVLAGEASAFTLELPPYRRPAILRTLYTSLIDRTLFVLWRAMLTAAPAGAVIWLLANIHVGGTSLAAHTAASLAPLGHAIGLDGAVLLAYIIAIPANEIVVPTLMMIYMGTGAMTDVTSFDDLRRVLIDENGWTLLTAVNLMLFSLLHNPCATTILTIYRETLSVRWATLGALLPLSIAFGVTFLVATVWRFVG